MTDAFRSHPPPATRWEALVGICWVLVVGRPIGFQSPPNRLYHALPNNPCLNKDLTRSTMLKMVLDSQGRCSEPHQEGKHIHMRTGLIRCNPGKNSLNSRTGFQYVPTLTCWGVLSWLFGQFGAGRRDIGLANQGNSPCLTRSCAGAFSRAEKQVDRWSCCRCKGVSVS